MMMQRLLAASFFTICTVCPAAAQSWPERTWVTVNGGAQTAGSSFSDSFTIQQFGDVETGSGSVSYPAKAGGLFDGSFGVRVWKRLGAGVGVTYMSRRGSAPVDARIPHPFFLNQFRTVQGSTRATRNEVAAHVQLSYLMNVTRRVRAIVSAGPSMLSVEQTIVTDVQYTQQYPYDTATFSGVTAHRASTSVPAFNVSGDVVWMLGRQFGAGGLVRFTRATARESAGDGRTVSVKAGGVQAGAGIRMLF